MHEVSTTDEAGVLKGACVDFTGSIPAGSHSLHVPRSREKREIKAAPFVRVTWRVHTFSHFYWDEHP